MRKNVASQVVGAQLVSATDGSAFTGAVTVAVTGDGGTQATGSVGSGACTHEGNGYHTYTPAQAETNYDIVAFTFTGTGAVPATVQVYTVSFDPHDTVRLGLTALPNAAASAAGGLLDKLLAYFQLATRTDGGIATDRAAELAELNADEGSGAGTFDNTAAVSVNTTQLAGQTVTAAAGVTFPSSVASPTNITAGTITTVTNLTNAPTAGDLTATMKTSAQTAANDALVALHLDHLLAADYDPAAKPGVATALLNELIGSDAGVSQFTANALELAPTGGGGGGDATLANQTTIITHLTDIKGATFAGATDSLEAIRNRGDTAWVTATGFSTLTASEVNAEVVDALNTDTYAEPAGAPAATATLAAKVGHVYKALRNRVDVTANAKTFYSDAGAAEWSKVLTDDGTTYSEAEGS